MIAHQSTGQDVTENAPWVSTGMEKRKCVGKGMLVT